jgi:hypothetical protein
MEIDIRSLFSEACHMSNSTKTADNPYNIQGRLIAWYDED